jgi:formylglycine-generating enzyme required for sulfatase activity
MKPFQKVQFGIFSVGLLIAWLFLNCSEKSQNVAGPADAGVPKASFTITPSFGVPDSTLFTVNANSTSDNKDAGRDLQVRWDWEGDGVWDTNFSTTKLDSHRFSKNGVYAVTLLVRDSDAAEGTAIKVVTITEAGDGIMPVFWVTVPEDSFMMGDSWGRYAADERPSHKVKIASFKLSQFEITNAQYAAFLNLYKSDSVQTGAYAKKIMIYENDWGVEKSGNTWQAAKGFENFPVIYVTWYGAYEFARYYHWRLPTEAEWELAARGGGETQRWSGTNDSSRVGEYAWYYDNNRYRPSHVGSKKPNQLGLYDMSGNVCEWCQDWYKEDYYSVSQVQNPTGPESGELRVNRDGSWLNEAWHCRTTVRNADAADEKNACLGFRVASSL